MPAVNYPSVADTRVDMCSSPDICELSPGFFKTQLVSALPTSISFASSWYTMSGFRHSSSQPHYVSPRETSMASSLSMNDFHDVGAVVEVSLPTFKCQLKTHLLFQH